MEKKQYNAPAIEMMRVQAETVLAATSIHISDVEATEDAGAKGNDFDDENCAYWQ